MRSELEGEEESSACTPGMTAARRLASDWKNCVLLVVRRIMRAAGYRDWYHRVE